MLTWVHALPKLDLNPPFRPPGGAFGFGRVRAGGLGGHKGRCLVVGVRGPPGKASDAGRTPAHGPAGRRFLGGHSSASTAGPIVDPPPIAQPPPASRRPAGEAPGRGGDHVPVLQGGHVVAYHSSTRHFRTLLLQ